MSRLVAVIVGSLRKESVTRKMAHALIAASPPSLAPSIVEIGALQMYNQDLEDAGAPPEWQAFRRAVSAADAVLFVTPEYNRSIPGALKNALDVGSRPSGKSAWAGKPGAVVSLGFGMLGGFGANHHLRQSLVYLNVPVMQAPEAYISNMATLFDDAGALKVDSTREFITKFMASFAAWVGTIAPA
ncbi:MAG: dehydrogenase (quinone):NADPH-dependent reductase [Gemmatimonadetes bacterium]|nr:dehydrogenase (quinone):NADPH-dependent reductase [Gemmatimonadota bacterium]